MKNYCRFAYRGVAVIFALALAGFAFAAAKPDEDSMNDDFCRIVGGEREVRHYYQFPDDRGYIIVDCETETEVWEGGLDKRSSLDSLQQAIFFSVVTGKNPAIVIYNTDGVIGQYEYRIQSAAKRAGVRFQIRR